MKDIMVGKRKPFGFTLCKAMKSATNPDSYALLEMLVEQIVWCGQAPDEGKHASLTLLAREDSGADKCTDGNMFPILDWQLPSLPGLVDPLRTRSAEFNVGVGMDATGTNRSDTDSTSRGLLGRAVVQDSVDVLH